MTDLPIVAERAGFLPNIHNQVAGAVEVETFSWRDDGRGAVFGDDGGAGVFLAGLKIVAGVDLRF